MPYFLTRARAIDMLGRQQIAGISTAVSELFKNAYDAYAGRVEADLLRPEELLVLRDDGIGMTLNDFTSRWLTIATDSKVENAVLSRPKAPIGAQPRPTLGEKGIGRLAIATIGPTALVLTRAQAPEERDEIVCALFDWEMFELPGINLNEIEIPIITRSTISMPAKADVEELVDLYLPMLETIAPRTDGNKIRTIRERLLSLDLDPRAIQERLGGMTLAGQEKHGTFFFVRPVDERLTAELNLAKTDPSNPSSLIRLLIGFANTMTPDHPPEPIKTAFRDHQNSGEIIDVISPDIFFTPEEFKNADHQVTGAFDELGTFRGTVSVYGERIPYELPFAPKGERRSLACGPFRFSLAVVQTNAGETTIPTVEYEALKTKLDRYGGLYIYNNNIRVLPYGDSRTDFIDVERRRTQNFGRYFFSYRRMFGVIEIDREHNSSLKEKAGREGFRENKAFSDFRSVLVNFFIQVAADFFATGGAHSDRFIERRDRLKHLSTEAKRKTQESARQRADFQTALFSQMEALSNGGLRTYAERIMNTLRDESTAARSLPEEDSRRNALYVASQKARADAENLRAAYRLEPPIGLALTPRLRQDVESYGDDLSRQLALFVQPILQEADENLVSLSEFETEETRRSYLRDAVRRAFTVAETALHLAFDGLFMAASDVAPRSRDLAAELDVILNDARDWCVKDLGNANVASLSNKELFQLAARYEQSVTDASEQGRRAAAAFVAQLERLRWHKGENGDILMDIDVSTAIEDRLLALEEQASTDLELTQLGLFSQIISHEFIASMTAVRHSIGRLNDYAVDYPILKRLHEDLRASFDALDGYLRLFTPLQRRLYSPRTTVRGKRLFPNVKRVFEERLSKAKVKLTATNEFLDFEARMYPSTLFPVLVNLIDNALYWLEGVPEPRLVELSASENAIFVSNNGPGIADRDRLVIFEPGFSRKPDGRGLGLWISQQALNRDGYDLVLAEPRPNMNVTFAIEPTESTANPNIVTAMERQP